MAVFHKKAELAAFPRPLLDDLVRSLLDAVEQMPLTGNGLEVGDEVIGDVRLVEGEHPRPGARYRYSPPDGGEVQAEVTIVSWDRSGECRIDVRAEHEEHVVTARMDLQMSGGRPQSIRVSGGYQGPRPRRWLRRVRWEGEVRFEEWWAVLGQRTPPISLRVTHPLAFVSFLLNREKDAGKRWATESTLRFGGRTLMRPLVGLGLLIMRRSVRRTLEESFSSAVSKWNEAVPHIVEHGLQERLAFRHEVKIKTVPREWAEAYVAALHQAVQELRFEDGRLSRDAVTIDLLHGEHAEPGARYRITLVADEEEPQSLEEILTSEESLNLEERRAALDALLKQIQQSRRSTLLEQFSPALEAWSLEGRNRIEFHNGDDVRTGWVELDSAQKPRTVLAGLDGTAAGYEQQVYEARLDLERWWAAGGSETPALTCSISHLLYEGSLTVTVSSVGGKEWTVAFSAAVEGRDWARPLVAAVGTLYHPFVTDDFREKIGVAAPRWNHAVSEGTRMAPEEAAHATLSHLLDELEFD